MGDDGEFGIFGGLWGSSGPGSGGGSLDGNYSGRGFYRGSGMLDGGDWGRGGAIFVSVGKFGVTRGLFGVSRFRVDILQSAAAYAGFGETGGAGVQGGEALVQAKIGGGLRERGHERAKSFGGHVVGNEKLGIGEGGTNGECDCIGIVLVDGGSGGFELVDDDGRFIGGNKLCR